MDQGSEVGACRISTFATLCDDPIISVLALILSVQKYQRFLDRHFRVLNMHHKLTAFGQLDSQHIWIPPILRQVLGFSIIYQSVHHTIKNNCTVPFGVSLK